MTNKLIIVLCEERGKCLVGYFLVDERIEEYEVLAELVEISLIVCKFASYKALH